MLGLLCCARAGEDSRRLEEIPGIGPIVATAPVAEIGDWRSFRSGRSLGDRFGTQAALDRRQRTASLNRAIAICDGYSRRCHGRHSLRTSARHQTSLAHPNNGSPTCKGGSSCTRQQDRAGRWAIMVRGERYKEPKLLLTA